MSTTTRAHSAAYRRAVHPNNTHWTTLRWARYRHQHGRCAVCWRKLGMRFEAHHLHYRTLGQERLNDIRIVHPGACHWLADTWRRQSTRFWRWWWGFMRDV